MSATVWAYLMLGLLLAGIFVITYIIGPSKGLRKARRDDDDD